MKVDSGERIAVVGKSSLLNILGLIDRNYEGVYNLFNVPTKELSMKDLAIWRNQKVGFVLQESALINFLTIEDNIKLPLLYAKHNYDKSSLLDFEYIINAIDITAILKKKPLDCSVCQEKINVGTL